MEQTLINIFFKMNLLNDLTIPANAAIMQNERVVNEMWVELPLENYG